MPVPSTMADLSTTAGSNSPAGSEAIGNNLDNYLRATQAIVRSTYALATAAIAAASTVDLATSDAESAYVSGSATISSFGTGYNGCYREVRFAGACTIVNSANIILPGGVNITTAAGDVLSFRCTASGVWLMTSRSKIASGDVTTALGYTPANKAGDTFTGNISVAVAGSGSVTVTDAVVTGKLDASAGTTVYVGATSNHTVSLITNNVVRGTVSTGGVLQWGSAGVQLNGGFTATKMTVSSSAPGALAQGEIWFKY